MTDFDRIYRENQGLVFGYLMRLCRDRALCEELTQETFYRAYINLKSLKCEDKASSWLMTIARNSYLNMHREQRKLTDFPTDLESDDTLGEGLEYRELVEEARQAADALNPPYREVFLLYVRGLSLKEISEMYGKSESWARVTFHRAKLKIIERMKKNEL